MTASPSLLLIACPVERTLHDPGERAALVAMPRTDGVAFRCPACDFRFVVSRAELRRLLVRAMIRGA